MGGLTDVETRGMSGLEDKLVCSFILAAVESGSLCMTLTDQHSWKEIWWDCVWMATGRSGFHTIVVRNVQGITLSTL